MNARLTPTALAFAIVLAVAAPAAADQTSTATEGRIAVAKIDSDELLGWVFITMGEQGVGIPPAASPARTACIEIIDIQRGLFDEACADADVFVDDLFMFAEGQASIPSTVKDRFGQVVEASTLSFEGTWSAATDRTCEPGHDAYASAPVFIAADAAVALFCTADVTITMRSAVLGTPEGALIAATGVLVGETFRGQ
jgi:hypothetical protein